MCKKTTVVTHFSSAVCGACLEELLTRFCGGCGRRLAQRAPAGSSHRDHEPTVAFRRSWHNHCLLLFHPELDEEDSGPEEGAGAAFPPFSVSLLAPTHQDARGAARASAASGIAMGLERDELSPKPGRGWSGTAGWGEGAAGPAGGSPRQGRRSHETGIVPADDAASTTYLFYSTPVPRGLNGELVDPVSPMRGTGSDMSDDDGGRRLRSPRTTRAPAAAGAPRTRGRRISAMGEDSTTLESIATKLMGSDLVKTRRYRLQTFESVVVGREVVDFLVARGAVPSRLAAVDMGQQLISNGFMEHVTQDHDFEDAELFYRFCARRDMSVSAGSAGSAATPTGSAPMDDEPAGAKSMLRQASNRLLGVITGGGAPGGEGEVIGSRKLREMRSTLHKEGFMHKQGHRRKNWQRRWFVLKGYELAYYKQPQDRHPKGVVDIRAFVLTKSDGAPNSMSLINRDKASLKYNLRAQSDGEFVEWMRTISSVMQEWQDAAVMAPPEPRR